MTVAPSQTSLVRLAGLMVAVPVALLAFGLWQVPVVGHDVAQRVRMVQGFDREVGQIGAVVTRDPHTVLTFRDGRRLAAPDALALVRGARDRTGGRVVMARIRFGFTVLAVVAGLVALIAGLAGWLVAAALKFGSVVSRERLVMVAALTRRTLPAVLGVQYVAIALGVTGVVFSLVMALFSDPGAILDDPRPLILAIALAGVLLAAAWKILLRLRAAFSLFAAEPYPLLARELADADAPGLWALVRDAAQRQAALAPDHIVVGVTDGFHVTSGGVRLLPEERVIEGRTLHVPLTTLSLLGREETLAVIGHELAHFAGEDTVYSLRFLPTYASLHRSALAMMVAQRRPPRTLVLLPGLALSLFVTACFDEAVSHWSRQRELQADRAGAALVTPLHAGSALIRIAASDDLTTSVLRDDAARPMADAPHLIEILSRRMAAFGVPAADGHLQKRQPHPTDRHPPVSVRLESMGVVPDEALLSMARRPVGDAETAFIAALFADLPELCTQLSVDFRAKVAADNNAINTALAAKAAEVDGTETVYYEQPVLICVAYGALALLALLVGAGYLYLGFTPPVTGTAGSSATSMFAFGGVMLSLGLYGSYTVFNLLRDRAAPFLILRPEGFASAGLEGKIDWLAVRHVRLNHNRTTCIVTVFLRPDAPEPPLARRHRRLKWLAKPHALRLRCKMIVTPKRNRMLSETIDRYVRAAYARAALRERGVEGV
ncbi:MULTISPECIES: M48 family metallopeptidase [Acidiphilium]|uniref:Zn-dependent protease with chaperone function n=1 Tax=Acidiphilium rubrum TaxID=526 RepID=A0A8G2CI33_ACIRU|nr:MULTISPECIES: M48 family metallopeptidase [Acidiphilium]SIQ18360.1 Zn-dependent protease with chaperone function [Acidiphilium rubrum]